MNILYYTCDKVHSTKGGTERTTITVASQLKSTHGCRCFSIYERQAPTEMEDCFENEFFWPIIRNEKQNIEFLRNIIVENKIDAIIVQGAFVHVARFRKAIEGLNCRLIFAHHFQPKAELEFFKFKDIMKRHPESIPDCVRWGRDFVLYPLLRRKYEKSLADKYKSAYMNADNVVLLSHNFIDGYCKFGAFEESSKFRFVPNGLSFYEYLSADELDKKKQIVLIVSRLEDRHKKISDALKIWGEVKKYPESKGWVLKIVGTGPDKEMYNRIIREERIPSVSFEGRQIPIPYYKEASIFMMTSKSESWGLTLTESQQMGVVPIAFNTYESLCDIITDNVDGRIITQGDTSAYVNAMLELMTDKVKRHRMAEAGLQTCHRFSPDKIAALWWQLLSEE